MMIILRIIALLIRVYAFKSKIINKLSNIFFFKSLLTVKESIIEYNFIENFSTDKYNFELEFIVIVFLN
jgi:hypothetical protein